MYRWRWWAIFGALLHVGLALTMELGMFPFGMLALYPVLFGPWTCQALDRLTPWLPEGWGREAQGVLAEGRVGPRAPSYP